jgi:hypothetical protein
VADERDKIDYGQQGPEQSHSFFGTALAIGSLVGAGALGWKFRSQIGTGLRAAGEFTGTIGTMGINALARNAKLKETMEDIGTFAKSLNKAMDNKGVFSHLGNPSRFEDRFSSALQQSLESRARGAGIPFGNEDLEFETQIEELRTRARQIPNAVLESQRSHYVGEELQQKHSWLNYKEDLGGHLASYGSSWMHGDNLSKTGVTSFIDHVLENNKALQAKLATNKVKKEDFVDSIYSTLDRYRDKGSAGFNESGRRQHFRDTVSKMKHNMWDDLIKANKNKRKEFNEKVMANNGYRPATVEDIAMHKNGNLFDFRLRSKPKRHGEPHIDTRLKSKVNLLMKKDPRVRDMVADSNLWINARGEFLDNRWITRGAINFADGFRRTVQIPFLRFNPLDLLHFTTWEGTREAPKIAIRRMGTIDPALHGAVEEFTHPLAHNKDAAVGVLARNYMQTSNGNVYDLTTGDLVKQDVYQASGRFGMVPRALAGMANLHTQEYAYKEGFAGFMQQLFDVGKQETVPSIKRAWSGFTKFDDPEWGQNLHNSLVSGALPEEDVYKLMFSQLEAKSTALSDDTVNYINQHIKNAYGNVGIDLTKLDDPVETMDALGKINQAMLTRNSDIAKVSTKADGTMEGLDKFINDTWLKYANDRQGFLRNKRVRPNNAMYMPEWMSALDMHDTEMIDKVDDVKRLVHMHALRQLEYATGDSGKVTVASLVQKGIDEGVLGKDSLKEVRNLESLSTMRQWWDDVYKGSEADKSAALNDFATRVTDASDPLAHTTKDAMKEMNPWYTMGPGEEPPQYFGFVNNLSMNKAKGARWALENYNQTIKEGGDALDAIFSSAKGVFGQFFAGRKNLGDVTTATLFPYYYAERLDNAVSYVGAGLSQKNRGSFQQIMANQFMRRIVLPYVAFQQLAWANGVLGDKPTDTLADGYVNMRTDVQWLKEFTGLNDIGRQWSRVFSGGDQLAQMPITKAFNFATFGIFSDYRSGEDEEHYWESGEDPVRKGRYWSVGSGTPYTGGRIDRFEPNWYRKMKSDYKFTDTLYGSKSEYYANAWFPTLTHPFAPIKHFLLDPYHWENKHKDDRPYPETGGFSELEQIPLIGSAVDNTVGRVLKPHLRDPRLRKAHREYIEELNDNIAAQYNQMQMGGYLQGMPAGGTGLLQDSEVTDMQVSASGGYASDGGTYDDGSGGGGYGIGDGSYSPFDTGSAGSAGAGGHGVGHGRGSRGATGAARQQIALVNAAMADIGGPALGVTGKNIHSVSSLEDLRDPDVIANLHDIGDYYSLGGAARDSFYSASEIGGIYGFLTKSAIGWDESGRGMVLDTSNRMTSYQRSWWDNELGGLGGGLSEIFRRYLPRDPNKNYWNPIRNRMPYWMPGADYFVDFQHGDPYVKVAHGEMRLPGAAYESLYKLHPDAFGEYGAFDRYRILADVAPYSQQFKFYKQIVSKMNGAGMLDESEQKEYGEIRDQVSQKKEKYRFYDRQFTKGYSDVNYETVHITRMLDATTFMTAEHPNNPIRMAAVKVKASDEESQQWLSQYVHEGATVKIATDKDPLNSVRDDTYGTMRAVVYNRAIGNVNFALANRKTGGIMGLGGSYSVSTHDDGTATSKRALYSDDMITVGKLWEWTTHTFLPNVPVVGTIADKFLQIRDPIEMYKKQEIYGKAWRPWTDPIGSWIKPMVEQMASNNPIIGAAQGAGIGWLFTKATGRVWGTHVGAIVGGAASTIRVFGEQLHRLVTGSNDTWIPKRRQQEREINEYFDMLHYMKYHGLYEKARVEAIRHEGVDVEDLIQSNDKRGQKNKGKRKYLESTKKWLSMAKKLGYGDSGKEDEELGNVRDQLKTIDGDRPLTKLGPMAMLALRYKSEYESTLYGADPNGDMTKIFRALPNKDREFFQKFMNAAPSEREEILRMVPENERRFFQAKWGLKMDDKPSLDSYFKTHYLPGANWAGWKPDVSLENYKVKVIQNQGLELTEFGDWSDDEKRAAQSSANLLPMNSMSSAIDVGRIERVLRGAGLDNVKVTMDVTQGKGENKIKIGMDLLKDRSNDIINELNNNMSGLISSGAQMANGIIKGSSANQS